MGLGVSDNAQSMIMATENRIYRFDNILSQGQRAGNYDALYVPHISWITGDLDIHDVCFREGEPPLFVNTLFNCIGTVTEGYSFKPVWKPDFISAHVAEDRCHLNGMATENGQAKFATCVAATGVMRGWKDRRVGGGLLLDAESSEIVAQGLTMPHSPRLHNGKLWLLNSGSGDLGFVDQATGHFEPVSFCPGFARGLALFDKYAVVAMSHTRDDRSLQDLPLQQQLDKRNADTQCGILVIDTETGATLESIAIHGMVTELFDVTVLKNVKCPTAIGILGDEINTIIAIDEAA